MALKIGIGDDCAVFNGCKNTIITTDLLVENIHFERKSTSPETLGYKSLIVNLSDIASMGGVPLYFTVSIAIEKNDKKYVSKIYKGLKKAGDKYNCLLIGGDTSTSKKNIFISITAIGKAKKPVSRNGAKTGDLIFITGTLGGSALGLKCLQKNNKLKFYIQKHLKPNARIKEGLKISRYANSMIDISDGLLSDIRHICDSSNKGYDIFMDKIPVEKKFFETARKIHADPMELILSGGEDYELLFTADPKHRFNILKLSSAGCPITEIGVIKSDVKKRNVYNKNGEVILIKNLGFDHFKDNDKGKL